MERTLFSRWTQTLMDEMMTPWVKPSLSCDYRFSWRRRSSAATKPKTILVLAWRAAALPTHTAPATVVSSRRASSSTPEASHECEVKARFSAPCSKQLGWRTAVAAVRGHTALLLPSSASGCILPAGQSPQPWPRLQKYLSSRKNLNYAARFLQPPLSSETRSRHQNNKGNRSLCLSVTERGGASFKKLKGRATHFHSYISGGILWFVSS